MKTAKRIVCTCRVCGTNFIVCESRIKHGAGKFCSSACCVESKRKQVRLECETCGKAFHTAISRLSRADRGPARFCSRKCAAKGATKTPVADRFWRYVDRRTPDECWNWTGSMSSHGYGQLGSDISGGSPLGAHRVSWQLQHGKAVPKYAYVLHKCDNRACVNPSHLFVGSCLDNALDASQKGRLKAGEKHHAAKLTAKIVRECRELYKSHANSIRALARKHGVGQKAMSDAVHGRTWAHV